MAFSLGPFAQGAIEASAARAAQQALLDTGATWATARVSGQWVTLEGAPPSRTEADRAIQAVRDARAQALFGSAHPITRTWDRFGPPAASTVAEIAAASARAPLTPEAAAACEQSLANLLSNSSIEFETASDAIGPESQSLLDAVARAAAACPGTLRIEGHTDNSGTAAMNQDLSQRRAEAVRDALVSRGLSADRLDVAGFGATRPLATNDTPAGRNRNRRIEMRVAQTPS